MPDEFSLEQSYDEYERIEAEFQSVLDISLDPRGPEMLYDLVAGFGLEAGSRAVDVGCGKGRHAVQLAARFGLDITGIDPVHRHIDLANQELAKGAERTPGLRARVRFEVGVAEALPFDDARLDLVWCRDVLVHVIELDRAFTEFRRVLKAGGHALVYQSSLATDRLEPREADWLQKAMGIVPSSVDPVHFESAMSASGLRVDERIDIGSEWGELAQERSGAGGRRLIHAARLLRNPQRYITRFGQAAYDIMLGDCLWHVYRMIGKHDARVYLLSRP